MKSLLIVEKKVRRASITKFVSFWMVVFFNFPAFAELELEIKHSEAASFLHFMDSGFKDPFSSKTIIKLLVRDGFGPFKKAHLKKEFKQLKSYLHEGYNFPNKTPNRNKGFWGEDGLIVLAVESKNIKDFERRLSVLLPYAGIQSYQKLKRGLYPFFLKKLWNPSLKQQKEEISKVRETISKTKFEGLLEKARKFYKSEYPTFLPFKVGLVPIPDKGIKKKHTSAQNIRDAQVVPYMLTMGVSHQLDVIFHEFCHALYAAQPDSVKNFMDNFYMSHRDPHALFVYRYINEILATAWGNGIYQRAMKGKLPKGDWYDVLYINKMAKAIFPIVDKYAKKNMELDKKFLEETIKQAKLTFPKAPIDINTNFMAINIFVDSNKLDLNKMKTMISSSFRVQSYDTRPSVDLYELNIIKNRDLKNVVLISKTSSQAKSKFIQHLNMKKIESEIDDKKNFLAIFPQNGRYVLWFNVDDEKSFSKLLQNLKNSRLLPRLATVVKL